MELLVTRTNSADFYQCGYGMFCYALVLLKIIDSIEGQVRALLNILQGLAGFHLRQTGDTL